MERPGPAGEPPYAAVVLAGGAARRLGGAAKPGLTVAGRPMLARVLAAVADADARIVVGPSDLPVPDGVLVTREEPPGAGPVAAAAAGVALVPSAAVDVALLAADLPLLTSGAVGDLRRALGDADVAVFLDPAGRRQTLCGVWRTTALRTALDRLAERSAGLAGLPVRHLLADVRVAEVSWVAAGPPPWFDCDTGDDLRRAEEWAR